MFSAYEQTIEQHLKKLPLQKRLQAMENIRRHAEYLYSFKACLKQRVRFGREALYFDIWNCRQTPTYWIDVIDEFL